MELPFLALALYRSRINRQIAVLKRQISDLSDANKPIIMNEMMYWFTFDSMGEFAFSQDFGMMRDQEWHSAVIMLQRALSFLGPLAPVMWLIQIGFQYASYLPGVRDWFAMLAFCNTQMENRKEVSLYFTEHF
jgi:tryprostatin B 6-hydroxylase